MTTAVPAPPKLLLERGKRIAIPANVWFIGTANHDETTKDFADKTFDRSHVMELPRKPAGVPPSKSVARDPIALSALEKAFDAARKTYGGPAEKAYSVLGGRLAEPLERHFRLGWGNRLERQAQAFIPVVLAAGGTVGEALDHLLATKLLRKIRDRHDNATAALEAVRKHIVDAWPDKTPEGTPAKSLRTLDGELRRLGSGADVSSGAPA